MTLFDQVPGMIEQLSLEPVREECIAERPRSSLTGQVSPPAHELTTAKGFERVLERLFAVRWSRHGDLASAA